MAMSLEDFLIDHSVDRATVDAHKERMLAEVRVYGLRELRECASPMATDAASE